MRNEIDLFFSYTCSVTTEALRALVRVVFMSEDSKLCTAAYFADECGPEIRLCGKGESAAAVLDDNAELFCCFRDPLSCTSLMTSLFPQD